MYCLIRIEWTVDTWKYYRFALTTQPTKPPQGIDRYDYKLQIVFAEAYRPDVVLRANVVGSTREGFLFLTRSGHLVTLSSGNASVWLHEYRESVMDGKSTGTDVRGRKMTKWSLIEKTIPTVPVRLEDYQLHRFERTVSTDLQRQITDIWRDALEHASHTPAPRMGLDGLTRHYAMRVDDTHTLEGCIWSPDENTIPEALGTVERLLGYYVQAAPNDLVAAEANLGKAMEHYWTLAGMRTGQSRELVPGKNPFGE